MRWLLMAEMPGLPLTGAPGRVRRWLPRAMGAAVPALVAISFLSLGTHATYPTVTCFTAIAFGGLAIVLFLFYSARWRLTSGLAARGWLSSAAGIGPDPDQTLLPTGVAVPGITLRVILWSITGTVLIALLVTLFPVTFPRVVGA